MSASAACWHLLCVGICYVLAFAVCRYLLYDGSCCVSAGVANVVLWETVVTVQAGTWGIFPVFWAEDKVGFGGVGVPQSAGKCVCIMASDTFWRLNHKRQDTF